MTPLQGMKVCYVGTQYFFRLLSLGFGAQGLRFAAEGMGCGVWGVVFGVWVLECVVWGYGLWSGAHGSGFEFIWFVAYNVWSRI